MSLTQPHIAASEKSAQRRASWRSALRECFPPFRYEPSRHGRASLAAARTGSLTLAAPIRAFLFITRWATAETASLLAQSRLKLLLTNCRGIGIRMVAYFALDADILED